METGSRADSGHQQQLVGCLHLDGKPFAGLFNVSACCLKHSRPMANKSDLWFLHFSFHFLSSHHIHNLYLPV
jgi:hypothetical protein